MLVFLSYTGVSRDSCQLACDLLDSYYNYRLEKEPCCKHLGREWTTGIVTMTGWSFLKN